MMFDTSTCVNCGKVADKRCAKCRSVGYCSRECQIADFKKHKPICKVRCSPALSITPSTSSPNICNILRALPSFCRHYPLPLLPSACRTFALEQLIPLFVIHFTSIFQSNAITYYAPPIAVIKTDEKTLTLVTPKDVFDQPTSEMQSFITFRDFCSRLYHTENPEELEDTLMKAFLMLSYKAKCNQVASCFGLLVLRTLQTHQYTYQGERIIGWALQDGILELSHERITKLGSVILQDLTAASDVLNCLREGNPLPDGAYCSGMQMNDVHVWITFVLESGSVFDMDLSAFQFGVTCPSDCIVPIPSPPLPTTFHGMCTRNRILGANLPAFAETVDGLIREHAELCSNASGSVLTPTELKSYFFHLIDVLLVFNTHTLRNFDDPSLFWTTLKTTKLS